MKIQQVSTGALIVRRDGKFLLCKRSPDDDFMPGLWEIPGGGSEYGETPEEALKREIAEECGLKIVVHVPLSTNCYFMGEKQRVEINFFCTLENQSELVQLSSEHTNSAWVSLDELTGYQLDDGMRDIIKAATADLDYWKRKFLA